MMLEMLGRVRRALFLKVLLVFVGAFTLVATYFAATFWLVEYRRERPSLQATAVNYAGLVLDDIERPVDTTRAREIAERLGVGMRIQGPGVDWASSEEFPGFDDVELDPYPQVPGARAGFAEGLGFSADIQRGEYRYLLSLQAGRTALRTASPTDEILDSLFMLAVLAGVYFVTRRLLRPVRVLTEGVERLRAGDLDVEMPTRRTDELGRLIVSFNAMARAVRERIRARDQLLLDVSHEIRSPLTRMRVALEMMPDSPARHSVIEDIEETEAMIRELLETQRLDSPHGGLERSRIDVGALVRECVASLTETGPGVELKGADRPILADVDRERLRILVNNVLSNAIKYSDPKGLPVRVVLDSADGAILISFHDHGIGIAGDDLAYVFEPFYRADRSRSRDTGGYGIGLSLAKRIVEAHGGSIELSSRLGEGTSVLVSIPASGNGTHGGRPRW
ncbi:MAG: HAMP domain-containing sensor histidine kinase [Longimicrobiales bacterium]